MKILCMLPAARGVYPDEAEQRRFALMKSYANESTMIDVDYMPQDSGFSPWGGSDEPMIRNMNFANQFASELARKAETGGYDAFCPFGTLDIGVLEARNAGVRIPVVGQAETSMLYCGLLGRRFASCSYVGSERGGKRIREHAALLGVGDLYVGSTAIGIPNSEYPNRRPEVLARFVDCAAEARGLGAEVMGLVAMSICPTEFSAKELSEASGMPVVDALAAQISMAEMWHRTGLPPALLRIPRNN